MSTDHNDTTASPVEWAVASRAFFGQAESGDHYLVDVWSDGAFVAVVDGLGHGPNAAVAGRAAVAALEGHTRVPIDMVFRHCHKELLGTRGVVMSVALLNALNGTMTWAGVGNVRGFLLRTDIMAGRKRETLLSRGGVVGYQLPNLYPVVLPVSQGDVLVFATDGLRSNFTDGVPQAAEVQQIADYILETHGRGTDDALVVAARYVGKEDA